MRCVSHVSWSCMVVAVQVSQLKYVQRLLHSGIHSK